MTNSWETDRGKVMEKLSYCEKGIDDLKIYQGKLNDAFTSFCINTAENMGKLKAKSSIWGALGGAITAITAIGVAVVVYLVKG